VVAVLCLLLIVIVVALAIDVGYIVLVRTQLQVAADSAAMAAAAAHVHEPPDAVVDVARKYAGCHRAGAERVDLLSADVEWGGWDFNDRTFARSSWDPNAIRVTARRDWMAGGPLPLFFARALGVDRVALRAEAVAAYRDDFVGFRIPPGKETLPLLPFALDMETWQALQAGVGADEWTWDRESGQVLPGPDGIPELNLYPENVGDDNSGNRGTVDIGSADNSTAEIVRQILEGPNSHDLAYHGDSLELSDNGKLYLTGDTGISTGLKDAMKTIRGQPRIVPLFSEVVDPGNNARFTIVGFAGIRIMEVNMAGSSHRKEILFQRAEITIEGGIPGPVPTQSSHYIYSPIQLVR